jgi:chaperone BCS1
MTKDARNLKAVTFGSSSKSSKSKDDDGEAYPDDGIDEFGIFHYGKWQSSKPPSYEPNFGSDLLWWAGGCPFFSRPFLFSRIRTEKSARGYHPILQSTRSEEILDITCLGRSTEPIKKLLASIQDWHVQKDIGMTSIRRPYGGYWDRPVWKISRPLHTVSLDQKRKLDIVKDIKEFLHPSRAHWYATRGIPYRRGVLLHGKCGTGKSSLSYALAGFFGLEIYCVSLAEPSLSESNLTSLFFSLPPRAIILLEDIDATGLRREGEPSTEDDDTGSDTSSEGSKHDDISESEDEEASK